MVRTLAKHGRRHWRPFALGAAAAVTVVASRLALPWPLKAVIDGWTGGGGPGPNAVRMALAMGLIFMGLTILLGLADLLERLSFARFSIGVVRDLRAKAFASVAAVDPRRRRKARAGDLVARLIGDTARIKNGLNGFLVHTATNGLLLIGVTIVLCVMDWTLGVIFAGAVLATMVTTAVGAEWLFRRSLLQRRKEGRLADQIQGALTVGANSRSFRRLNRSSGTHEAALTRMQGTVTGLTHVFFGVSVMGALWVGTLRLQSEQLQVGDLVVFMMYTLMMRAPIVQVARQGSRTGKILGTGYRLFQLIRQGKRLRRRLRLAPRLEPLQRRLRAEHIKVRGPRARFEKSRLGPVKLRLAAGERVLLLGPSGAGKTTLLEVLAGRRRPTRGRIRWDAMKLGPKKMWILGRYVSYVPQNPTWSRRSLTRALRLDRDDERSDLKLRLKVLCRLDELVAGMPGGLRVKLGSADLSAGERKRVGLVRYLSARRSVWLIDDPGAGLSEPDARSLVEGLLLLDESVTMVVTGTWPCAVERFDRVVELDRGRVTFNGAPGRWLDERSEAVLPAREVASE